MTQSELIALISGKEPEAITRALAMMAYIPAIGRVLEKGGVDRFADLMVQTIPKLYGTVSRDNFDATHAKVCEAILSSFKTNRNEMGFISREFAHEYDKRIVPIRKRACVLGGRAHGSHTGEG